MPSLHRIIVFGVLALAAGAAGAADTPTMPAARLGDGIAAPAIDGRVDDEAWRRTEPFSTFTQQDPIEGEPASERTEVRVLLDEKNIYFGIRAFDSEAIHINARDLVRDSDFPNDDKVEILLDTYDDRRNAFEKRTTLQKCAAIFARLERPELLRLDGVRSVSELHEEIVGAVDRGALFRAACLKSYLEACEPEHCSFRINRQCDYPYLGSLRAAPPVSAEALNAIVADPSLSAGEKLDRLARILRGTPQQT